MCHVKNTGRCRELLVPGARVLLEAARNAERKTGYDLVSVYKGERLVNMDSQAPNRIFREWAEKQPYTLVKPEFSFGDSRLDFYLETQTKKILAEIKGVTLEINDVALFPDAPTERGVKHLRELRKAAACGFSAEVYFIVQMRGIKYFTPSFRHHSEFFLELEAAAKEGVGVYAMECDVEPGRVEASGFVPVRFDRDISFGCEAGPSRHGGWI